MRTVALALALATALIAGCLAPEAPAMPPDAASGAPDVALPPAIDAAAVLADVKAFSEAYPLRRGNSDAHNEARAHLADLHANHGLEVVLDEFEAPVSRGATPTALVLGSGRLVNVCGIHWGVERPEEWIVVGAHYDVTDAAVFGAYDDASGTIIVQALGEAFAKVATPRTIVFCNFDGEEQGLRGSSHMMESMVEGSWAHANGTVVAMVDFDMAGIMYPSAPVLVADAVSPEIQARINLSREALGIPAEAIAFRGISGGSSDNGPFKAAEIPSVLFISDFDEVRHSQAGALPGQYPFWHRLDTYDGMVQMAEGEENLRAGFHNVITIGADLVAHLAGDVEPTFRALD